MADSAYYVAWQMTQNMDLMMRVAASVQQESEASTTPIEDPEIWSREHRWDWATQADWIAAVTAAIDTGITAWGNNPSVVTDQHILSYVQSAMVNA
jgi:hypothetical protein